MINQNVRVKLILIESLRRKNKDIRTTCHPVWAKKYIK